MEFDTSARFSQKITNFTKMSQPCNCELGS